MLVTCCIDSHCTAFQVLKGHSLIYYDPLSPSLTYIKDEWSFKKFVLFLLMKCKYGDSQHIQENKNYYTGPDSNETRRFIYELWRKINDLSISSLKLNKASTVSLGLDRYLLVNSSR